MIFTSENGELNGEGSSTRDSRKNPRKVRKTQTLRGKRGLHEDETPRRENKGAREKFRIHFALRNRSLPRSLECSPFFSLYSKLSDIAPGRLLRLFSCNLRTREYFTKRREVSAGRYCV